jgi:AcrR family transcriptional regulator
MNSLFDIDYEGRQETTQQLKRAKCSLPNKTAKVFGNGKNMTKSQKDDRRSKRSRQLIEDALVELMLEKHFDNITVQDILDRANVGRSTFYAHYTDKESLLAHEIARIIHDLEAYTSNMGHAQGSVLPSLELFRHVQNHRRLIQAFSRGRGLGHLSRELKIQVNKIIEPNLRSFAGEAFTFTVPLPLIATFVVNTFLMLLDWWIENNMQQTPEQMSEIFQKLVMPGIHGLIE